MQTKVIKAGLIFCLLLILISGASAETIFREQGNVGMQIGDTYWKIQQNSYITKLFNYRVDDINGTRYQVFWCWKNLNHKAYFVNCMQKSGAELLACATLIHDRYFPNTDTETFRTHFLDIRANGIPIASLTGGTQINTNRYLAGNDCGSFYLDTIGVKGEKFKIGYDSTIIELTDVDINIMVDPETEVCQDGHCIHKISVVNDKDSNHCMNSLDMYGEFPPEASNIVTYYNQPYQDENKTTTWYMWETFTTQRCITPHATGEFKIEYDVPLFREGKWDFVFWYEGEEYKIDPFYDSTNWEFTNPAFYDYNAELITVDGNAYLTYETEGQPIYNEVRVATTNSITLTDVNGSDFNVQTELDSNIYVTMSSTILKVTGGASDADINVAILVDGEIIRNVRRTLTDTFERGSIHLNGIKVNLTAGTHTIKAQFATSDAISSVQLYNVSLMAVPMEKSGNFIPHGDTLELIDTTVSKTFVPITGADFNITITEPSKIFGILTANVTTDQTQENVDILVSINGIDGNFVQRDLKTANSFGSTTAIYLSDELPAGTYSVVGKWQTSGGTATAEHTKLTAHTIKPTNSDIVFIETDDSTSGVLENIDGLDINISIPTAQLVVAYLSSSVETSTAGATDVNLGIAYDGIDSLTVSRNFPLQNQLSVVSSVTLRVLEAGTHNIAGRISTTAGTTTIFHPTLIVQTFDLNFVSQYLEIKPSITPLYALTAPDVNYITALTHFTETAEILSGTEIRYQLTDDNGSTFQYWTGSTWATADNNHEQANTATDINANLSSFTVTAPREVKFRAYLNSIDGNNTPKLGNIKIDYEYDEILANQPPTVPVLTDEPDGQYEGTVLLEWTASTDPEVDPITYRLILGTSTGANDVADINITDINYTTPSLTTQTHFWSVLACDDSFACSAFSIEDTFDINVAPPNQSPTVPSIYAQPDNENTTRDFDWNGSTDTELDTIRYHINIGTGSGDNDVLDANTFTTDYNSFDLNTGAFYWSVRACDNNDGLWGNCSSWDTEDVFTVLEPNQPPTTPILVAQPNDNNSIRDFDWFGSTDNEGDTIRYHINVGTVSEGSNKLDANVFTTDYNGFDLVSVGTYYWRVRACDNNYADGYENCSSWSSEDIFDVTSAPVGNQPPTEPALVSEPDDNNTTRNFDWNASTDTEFDTIRYHINVGTTLGDNDVFDGNTLDANYYGVDVSTYGYYFWQVRACDNNDSMWGNCSNWSTDEFQVFPLGAVSITAFVTYRLPLVTSFIIVPEFWNGDGTVFVEYYCQKTRFDLSRSWLRIRSVTLDTNNLDFNTSDMDLNTTTGKVSQDISSYFTEQANYEVMAFCQDDQNGTSVNDVWHDFYYTPDYNISINNGDSNTTDPLVDLYLGAPPTVWYMAFSCDNNTWTDWMLYDDYKQDWDLLSGSYGCTPHGEGQYSVYVAYLDGQNSVYTNFDTIYVSGRLLSLQPYINPNDPPDITSYFALATPDVAWGLVFVVGLVVLGGFFAVLRRREKYV